MCHVPLLYQIGCAHIQVTEYQIDVNGRNRQRCSVSAGICSVSTSRTRLANGRQISNKPTISGRGICCVGTATGCKHITNFTDVFHTINAISRWKSLALFI